MRSLLLSGFLAILSTSCALETVTTSALGVYNPDGGKVNVAALQAFQNGFYAFAVSQGCVNCHGSAVSPTFASSNVMTAYAAARGTRTGSSELLIDFKNPSASVFIAYTGNQHCGDSPCSNAALGATVQGLLTSWANAENAAPSTPAPTDPGTGNPPPPPPSAPPAYATAAVALPATIPAITQAAGVVRFDLTSLGVPNLVGALAEVEIQKLAGNQYRVNRLKIVAAKAALTITGVHVYIRPATGSGVGSEDPYQGNLWKSDVLNVTVIARPNPLPTGPMNVAVLESTALAMPVQSAADVMTLGFDQIK